MVEIRIDWARRLFVIVGDNEPIIAFRKYRDARDLYMELTA